MKEPKSLSTAQRLAQIMQVPLQHADGTVEPPAPYFAVKLNRETGKFDRVSDVAPGAAAASDALARATYAAWRAWMIENGYPDHGFVKGRLVGDAIDHTPIYACTICTEWAYRHHPEMGGFDALSPTQQTKYQRMGEAVAKLVDGDWREAVLAMLVCHDDPAASEDEVEFAIGILRKMVGDHS